MYLSKFKIHTVCIFIFRFQRENPFSKSTTGKKNRKRQIEESRKESRNLSFKGSVKNPHQNWNTIPTNKHWNGVICIFFLYIYRGRVSMLFCSVLFVFVFLLFFFYLGVLVVFFISLIIVSSFRLSYIVRNFKHVCQ